MPLASLNEKKAARGRDQQADASPTSPDALGPSDLFPRRHIGPGATQIREMLEVVGAASLDELIDQTIPENIRLRRPLNLPPVSGEHATLAQLRDIASRNRVYRSFIGAGYYDCITPGVIQRNILENPGWYTQYTPYQAEIAQGRLEALLNFQTMVADLTGLPLANASLLDEATAAAEAMTMCHRLSANGGDTFLVAANCHPQTIHVVQTRARPLGLRVLVSPPAEMSFTANVFGVLIQYPATDGSIEDHQALTDKAHAAGALVAVATDLLALTAIKPPGEFGADIAVGSSQRFGVPLGFGGPHAAFMSTRDEYKRQLPGRIVGVSKDRHGAPAVRLAIQTREQHIRREKATSNICTAQVLLAVMASMYAVYHGPEGLRRIGSRVHALTALLADRLARLGAQVGPQAFFDTIRVKVADAEAVHRRAEQARMNFRRFDNGAIGISLDETTTVAEVKAILAAFGDAGADMDDGLSGSAAPARIPQSLRRQSPFLTHPVFHRCHAEHEMLRYIHKLESRDLSLTASMIPLGSCTMKLNGTSEMKPITWPEFAGVHPFAPSEQTAGYAELCAQLERWLAEITGFAAVSLQPNSGAQGEYAGLLTIRGYHESRGEGKRRVCLIPVSAHGTNPASAILGGLQVIPVECDAAGNIDVHDLKTKAERHRDELAALMLTYPSTHGVFEEQVQEMCAIVHANGGLVYMDGANLNAQVGLCRPGDIGADVCHLNLHKTFCIPHGGGGPGMGPIACTAALASFLPGHPLAAPGSRPGPVSAAPYGSAGILPISWMYVALMGAEGLAQATRIAILNANYMAARLREAYPLLYTGKNGRAAHEFILDLREFKKSAGIEVEDVAKRLMDYGYHAPTMSWPVPGTLMIEPTESESKAELDRFCDAMLAIREEIRAVEQGKWPRDNNPLVNAPHTAADVTRDDWDRPYSRQVAAFPAPAVREHKFWPAVGRIDNVWGDRNLFCACPPMEEGVA